MTFKVHLDGYNLLPYLTGQEKKSPRKEFFYFSDDGDLMALRYDNWKLVFCAATEPGTLRIWGEPFVRPAIPCLQSAHRSVSNGRRSLPIPIGTGSSTMSTCWCRRRTMSANSWMTFKEFPPRQKAASFTIDQVLETAPEAKLAAEVSAVRYWQCASQLATCREVWHEAGAFAQTRSDLIAVGVTSCCVVATIGFTPPIRFHRGTTARQSKAIVDFRREGHEGRLAGFRAARRTHRHLRQRRHALGRAADVLPVAVSRSTA